MFFKWPLFAAVGRFARCKTGTDLNDGYTVTLCKEPLLKLIVYTSGCFGLNTGSSG